ncbi:S9 family peptidase [Echinicola sp. CAU 1574]|uniref:S9 family peptidase n=1 Tax=Echinicola arenosa TaxID=2774144 RepID=A0ABR9AFL5_9BACT|nr:S9 family peptidase [Echinicola arenosa]MBD8487634.1 S9 family peptidase [Echinicola arenosa]
MNSKPSPKASIKNKKLTFHGHERNDPYYWMNDRNNPEVIQYLNDENDFLKASLQHTEGLQNELYEEMKGRIKEDDQSVPYFRDGYFYFSKYIQGGEYPIFCRKKDSLDNPEEVLLDVNDLAKGHEYFNVSSLAISTNQNLLAFAQDNVGRRIYTIRFKNLKTGKILEDEIPEITGNITWANDNKTLFYSKQDPNTLRSFQIYKHSLGQQSIEDELIYEEKDETFNCHISKSKSKKYLFINSESTVSSEVRFVEADFPSNTPHLVQSRERDLEYSVEHFEDHFLIWTNHNKASNYKLVKTPVKTTGKENWIDVIPHRKDVLLESFEVFKDFLVLEERFNGLSRIQVNPWNGNNSHYINFEEPTYSAWISFNPSFESNLLRYGYNSLTTPSSTFDYDMISKEQKLLKQQEVLGGYDPSEYQAERIWSTADDETPIPISLVYKKSLFKKDGSNPLLQYAYGSYGYSTDALFNSNRLSLLDRGFVYAIAHIRGGQEMGRHWYEDGKMLKKRNTFTDFISCSEHLISNQYTSANKLFAMGGSAGGLLMGVIINLRPDLYKGVIAAVPFVDVVTTMLDESIPLTTGEFDEWGNPKEKAYYDYMLSYSPYDNIEKKSYPNLLVTSGLHDSQVQYWEPTKWVAKLRAEKTDDNLLLLYTNMDAGHGGASGRFHSLKELAMEYAFILNLT